ncbi:MAG: hypothetical protein Q9227_004363 [Pyrenula ochraceoflavens]
MAPQKEVVLKLSSFRYKRPGVSDKDLWEFGTKKHAPLAAQIQARHGVLKVTQFYTPPVSKQLITDKLPWVIQSGWEIADYDISVSFYVRTTDTMQAVITDPDFQALMAEDDTYLLTDKAKLTAGFEEVFVEDGKVLEPDTSATFEQRAAIGSESKTIPVANAEDIKI